MPLTPLPRLATGVNNHSLLSLQTFYSSSTWQGTLCGVTFRTTALRTIYWEPAARNSGCFLPKRGKKHPSGPILRKHLLFVAIQAVPSEVKCWKTKSFTQTVKALSPHCFPWLVLDDCLLSVLLATTPFKLMDFMFRSVNKVGLGVKPKCQFWQMTLECGEGSALPDTLF